MSARTPYRLAGFAMLVGGVLAAIAIAVGSFITDFANPLNPWVSAVEILGVILLLAGLPAFYGTFARTAGALGVVGFIFLFASGALLGIGGSVLALLVFPWLAQVAPNLVNSAPPPFIMNYFLFGGVVNLIGGLAFGAAILVTRAPERYAAILLLIGTVVSFAGQLLDNIPHLGDLGTALAVLSVAWMGYSLMTRHAVETTTVTERETATGAHARA